MAKQQEKPKPRSLQSIGQEVVAQTADPVFGNAGFGASFDFAGKDIDRYVSYGSKTYGKLGYDPFRDNSKFYNQHTSASADLQRAYTGMWKLAGIGFKDTFAFGATASNDAHSEFAKTMDTYGSTRKGTAGFIANTMLSSGYTVGIMGAIAAEELLLAGATALTGGASAPVTIAEGAGVAARGFGLMAKAQKVVKGYDKVADVLNYTKNIENARGIWASTARGSKAFIQKLAPMAETFDFIRNADHLKDLNGLQKSLQGVGALARDARKISMTNSESKLEANLAKDEFKEELIREWNTDKSHVGMTMDDATLDEINGRANAVFNSTYNGNLALIYATNAITFDSMFKSARLTNKMFGLHESLRYTVGKTATGKVSVTALEGTLKNYLKKEVSKLTWKGTVKKIGGASMEGVQEVGQDIISGTAKRYEGNNPKLQGNYMSSLYDSLGDIKAETFLSGMLMGTFAAPVGMTIKAVNKFTVGGGYRAVTDSKGYEKSKKSAYGQAELKAKELTAFFNDSATYMDHATRPLFAQSEAAEKMTEAAENGDRKTFEDKRNETFRIGLKTLLDTNMEGELLDHLSDLGNYTAEELNQSMGRTDITEDNKSEFIQRADAYSAKIKDFKKGYDQINRDHVNPISIQSLASDDPEFLEKKILFKAHESFKEELLFSQDRIKELATRQKELYDKSTDNKFTTTALNIILSKGDVAKEIRTLKESIASDKEYGMSTAETEKKQLELDALVQMESSLKNYDALGTDLEATEGVYDEMFEAYNNYRNAITGQENTPGNRVMNKKKFQEHWDYLNLRGESEVLQEHVNTMLDPTSSIAHIGRIKKEIKRQDENKETLIENSLKAFYTKQASDEMIGELLEKNIVFDHNELDDLIERGIMPTRLFDATTHKELTGVEFKLAQDIIGKHYANLTGKKIIASDSGYATKKKRDLGSDKRTSNDLVSEYSDGINKPIGLSVFIKKLLRSKHLGNTERKILQSLLALDTFKDKSIVLTESGESPIDVNKDGDIVLDVRFSSEDYEGGDVPFEYLAISALLQTHFTNQLALNPELKSSIEALMEDAKEVALEREGEKLNRATINNIPVFNDPVIFLSESLNNSAFQELLKHGESTMDSDGKTLWESLHTAVEENLGESFDGTLLNRAIGLAYLTITDEAVSEMVDDKVEDITVIPPTVIEGELSDIDRIENQINELINKQNKLKEEILKTKKLNFIKYNKLFFQISKIDVELTDLNQDLIDAKEMLIIREDNPIDPGHTITEDVISTTDDNGNLIVSGETPFLSLPTDLQVELAEMYIRSTGRDVPTIPLQEIDEAGAMQPNNEFDVVNIGIVPTSNIDLLTDDDLRQIQANMLNHINYIDKIADYNNNVLTRKIEPVVEEPITKEPVPKEYEPFTISSLISVFPTIGEYMSESKMQNRVNKLNAQTSSEEFAKVLETIAKEVSKLSTVKVEKDEFAQEIFDSKLANWKRNQQNINARSFKFNDEVFSLPKVDIGYFLEQYPHIMSSHPDEFMRAVYEFKKNSSMYAKSYKINPPTINPNSKTEIQNFVKDVFKQQSASSNVINSLNIWLRESGSPLMITSFNYKTGKGALVVERKAKYIKPVSQSEKTEKDLAAHFLRFGEDLYTYSQAEFMVYEFLKKNSIHPSAVPVREKRSYTSNSSKYVSSDGIGDAIFIGREEDLERLGVSAMDIVDDVLSSNRTIADLRFYLLNKMEEELKIEDDMYGSSFDGISIEEQDDEYLREYYNSVTYLIANNGYTGSLDALSVEELNLYQMMKAIDAGVNKEIEKRSIELSKQIGSDKIDKTNYDWTNNVATKLKSIDISLTDTLSLYKLINNPVNNITEKQRRLLNSLVVRRLQSDEFIGMVINNSDGVMRIMSSTNGVVSLQLLHTGRVVKMGVYDMAGTTSAVLEPGTEFDPTGFDNKVETEDAQNLSSTLGEIFNNLAEMNEFASMDQTTLMNSIVEELNKCK